MNPKKFETSNTLHVRAYEIMFERNRNSLFRKLVRQEQNIKTARDIIGSGCVTKCFKINGTNLKADALPLEESGAGSFLMTVAG